MVWRIWFLDVRLSVVLMRASMVSSNCVILRVWSKKSCARVELDSLSWLISNCCLFCVSRRAARLVAWFVRVIEWLFSVSAFWAVFALISLLFALISFRASSILTRGEDCEVLRDRVCEGLSRESKSWILEATEGELQEVWIGRRLVGGIVRWVEMGVWQILRILSAWAGELGLFRMLLMIRPASWEDGVTLHVGAMLHEGTLAKGWGFLLLLEATEVLGSLLGERAWDPEVWSKFGSKIRSEIRS